MIPAWKVLAIETLLTEGRLSQRQIAKQLKVWRGTVSAIADQSRPDYASLGRSPETELPQPVGPPKRCPHCGARVQLPCRACRIRAVVRHAPGAPRPLYPNGREEGLRLILNDAHRARYEEVRARRVGQQR